LYKLENIMNASNLLCEPLIPVYKDFKELNEKSFKGYKLVEKKNLNYYSIVTGLFRYKEGRISGSSYTSLYEKNPEFYNKELHNRLAVFKTTEDAEFFLREYLNLCDRESDLVILEIEISGDLKEAICSNRFVENIECVIGNSMIKIKEI
jgi:hypothetical protein